MWHLVLQIWHWLILAIQICPFMKFILEHSSIAPLDVGRLWGLFSADVVLLYYAWRRGQPSEHASQFPQLNFCVFQAWWKTGSLNCGNYATTCSWFFGTNSWHFCFLNNEAFRRQTFADLWGLSSSLYWSNQMIAKQLNWLPYCGPIMLLYLENSVLCKQEEQYIFPPITAYDILSIMCTWIVIIF